MAMRNKWLVLLPFKDRDLNQLEESFKKVIKVNNFPHTSLLQRVPLRLVTLISPLVSILVVILLDFHSTKQGMPLVDSWSRGLD